MKESTRHNLFATTRWTIVLQAAGADGQSASRALEKLCRSYWFPLYAYARRRGYGREDAEDLTQGFFHQLLKRRDLAALDAQKGLFRAFMLASFKHYMANEHDRSTRIKRGGDRFVFSLDWEEAGRKFEMMDTQALSPDRVFDREWASALLRLVLTRLRDEWAAKGKADLFDALRGFLTTDKSDARYDEAARQSGLSEGNLRVVTHRLRKRYRELLMDEIAHTLADPAGAEDELASLMRAFQ